MESMELLVQYSTQRADTYEKFLERLKDWISIRSRTIQGLLDLISYIDSFHKGVNGAYIVGSGVSVAGAGAVLLAPFTGGLSLAAGGIFASVMGATTSIVASLKNNSNARENCEKAQELINKDTKATDALTRSLKQYHEQTQKLNDCLRSVHGKINFKEQLPSLVYDNQLALIWATNAGVVSSVVAFASLLGKGASKAGARVIPVISIACIAIDIWSIVTTTADMKKGSKSTIRKELFKVVAQLRKQSRKLRKYTIEAIRIQSLYAACELDERKIIARLVKQSAEEKGIDSSYSDESDEDESSINFCLMNARSVFNKWREITQYVIRKSIDVLAVTETWSRGQPLVTTVPGYAPFFYSPREGRRGGGVGALIKRDIRVIKTKCNFDTFECINCIFMDSKARAVNLIYIYILYKPPATNFNTFVQEFGSLIREPASISKVIIMGDFNIDWTSARSSKIKELLRKRRFHQHVEKETKERGGILDWVVTRYMAPYRIKNLQVDSQIQMFMNLDHYPVTFTLELE